ncbi:MAG TPA: DoxX family protein [Usitatibacter sp.]|jgi:putative oxidoreductase|nr:DoxX family protein [Usitatibacter sp.]
MIDKKTAPFGALLLRISLGVMFLAHSLYLKLVVFTLPGTVKFFESLGLPAFATHLTIAVETIGGLMLIAGFKTRHAAIALLPVLVGASLVHWKNGWLFTNAGGGWEYPVFLAVATGVQALLGDGAYSVGARVGSTEVGGWQVATRS